MRAVAVVDDDEAKRYLLARRLKALGLGAVELGSAAAALDQAGAGLAAWVVDVRLPDRDGIALVAALRERGVQAPIYVRSAYVAEASERARARQAGATAAFTESEDDALLQALTTLADAGS